MISHHIFLIGFMGAGESTIAGCLKEMLNMNLIEMDQEIVQKEGMPIAQIFAEKGEEYFRQAETKLLVSLSQESPAVVSCGGGAVMREENVTLMKKNGKIVLLTASPETIYLRVKDSQERPVLNGNMNVEYISSLMEKRRPFYEGAADLTVSTDQKSPEEISKEIISNLNKALA